MGRPADWHVLDLPRDPTPGDVYAVRALSRSVERVSDDARRAERDVRSLAGDDAVLSWIGLTGRSFRVPLDLIDTRQARKVLEIPFDASTVTTTSIPTAAEQIAIRNATHAPVRAVVYGQTGTER